MPKDQELKNLPPTPHVEDISLLKKHHQAEVCALEEKINQAVSQGFVARLMAYNPNGQLTVLMENPKASPLRP